MRSEKLKTPKSKVIKPERVAEIEAITRKVFDIPPTRVALPGGTSRPVYIIDMAGKPYVIAKRDNKYDAKVEAIVLKALSPSGHVPEFIARQGKWIIQEFIDGTRLPIIIDEEADMSTRVKYVSQGLDSLLDIQDIARRLRLEQKVPRLGVVEKWIPRRIGAVDEISSMLNINGPDLQRRAIGNIYNYKQTDFVKWDSRPGNALRKDNKTIWFDWEDCGRRCRLDDLVCYLSDEWTNISAEAEGSLIEKYLPLFWRDSSDERATHYFYVAGCLQILFRLRLAVRYYDRDSKWWDRDYCLAGDKVGVTPGEVLRLCERLMRWSRQDEILHPFGPWAREVLSVLQISQDKYAA